MNCYLDRDGVINIDYGYVGTKSRLCIRKDIINICKILKSHNYNFIMVTNQSGLSRRFYTYRNFLDVSFEILECFSRNGIDLEIRYCRHLPNDKCNCRKPRIGMFIQDTRYIEDIIIGDKQSDMIAGINANIKNRWIIGCIANEAEKKNETKSFINHQQLLSWLESEEHGRCGECS